MGQSAAKPAKGNSPLPGSTEILSSATAQCSKGSARACRRQSALHGESLEWPTVSKRRLFYVAKTRAKDRLFPSMSCSASWRRGRLQLVLKRLAREAPQPLFPPSGGNR